MSHTAQTNFTNYSQMFNTHFVEFVEYICNIFPEDLDLVSAKNSLIGLKRINPRIFIKIWKQYITDKYLERIASGDVTFFIEKDYSEDVYDTSYSDKILQGINRLRDPIRRMDAVRQQHTMKYIQNLTNISLLSK